MSQTVRLTVSESEALDTRLCRPIINMGGVTGFLNIVAATGGAALLLYSTDALFYYTDERYGILAVPFFTQQDDMRVLIAL